MNSLMSCCCGSGGSNCAELPLSAFPSEVNISVSYSMTLYSGFWTVQMTEVPRYRPEDYEDECPEVPGPFCCCPSGAHEHVWTVQPLGTYSANFTVNVFGTLLRFGGQGQPLYHGQVSAEFEFASDFPYTPSRSGSYTATTNVPWSPGQPQAQGWHAKIECVGTNSVSRDLMKRQWGLSDTEPVIATGPHLVLTTGIGPSVSGLPSQASAGSPPTLLSDVQTSPPNVPLGQVQMYASPSAAMLPVPTGTNPPAIYSMPWRAVFALNAATVTGTYKGTRAFSRYAATPSGVWVPSSNCYINQSDADGPWLGPVDELGDSARGPTVAAGLWNWRAAMPWALPGRGAYTPPNIDPACWRTDEIPPGSNCQLEILGNGGVSAGVIQSEAGDPCYPDGVPPFIPPYLPSINAYRSDWAEMGEPTATVS